MLTDMENQFNKLSDIIATQVNTFYFNRSKYYGPVDPSAIITFGSDYIQVNALVLAEAVPTFQLPIKFGINLFEVIIVHLNENFEFNAYSTDERALGELNVLVGNKEYSYDGTIEQAKAYFDSMNWKFNILYQKKRLSN